MSKLRAVTHNAAGRSTRAQLEELAHATGLPHVLACQELEHIKGAPRGYVRVAADDHPRKDATALVLFVRHDLKLGRRFVLPMAGPDWHGPHLGLTRKPRVYPGVEVRVDRRWWDVLDVHRVPGGQARNRVTYRHEGEQLEAWVGARRDWHPRRPVVLIGDWNGHPEALERRLGGELELAGIDGALVVGAHITRVRELAGLYGSDTHNPVLITAKTGARK